MTDEMRGLIERIEGASEPCRVLDGDIACAIGLLHPRDFVTPTSSVPPAPEYTGSIDAAVTLVPKGWVWTLVEHCDGAVAGLIDDRVHPVRHDSIEVEAATPALALCAAALKALSTMGVKGDEA